MVNSISKILEINRRRINNVAYKNDIRNILNDFSVSSTSFSSSELKVEYRLLPDCDDTNIFPISLLDVANCVSVLGSY
jgi:hypothetical protein